MASIIKANQLQDFGGNSILTSDGAGNVTPNASGIKNTPNFYAYQTTATSLPNNANTKVTFDTEVMDSNNAFSSSRFTVPSGQAGKYFFHFSVEVNANANGSVFYPILFVNGASNTNGVRSRRDHPGSGSEIAGFNQSAFYDASVGDYFEIYFYQNCGSTKNTNNSSQGTFFFGYKMIGA